MLKCLVIVLCAITIVFCADEYENLREKQSARQEHVTDHLSVASRTKRQSLGTVEIVYVDAASIGPIKLKDLQSKQSFALGPVNDVTNPGKNFQQLSGNNLEVVTQNSNYVVYKLKNTDDLPLNGLPNDKRAQVSENQFYGYANSGYSGIKNPSPNERYNYYNRPLPPPRYNDRSTEFYEDRQTRQSSYDRPPPPHRGGPPHDRGPPPRDGGRPPRYEESSEYQRGPPLHHDGRPRRDGPPDRHDHRPPPHHGGPPPHHGGPPNHFDDRPPPHHGGPPHRFDDRPPPHHRGPPHRFDDRPPPPPDRYYDRPDRRPPHPPPNDRRPPPDQNPHYNKGNENNKHSQDDHLTDVTPTSSTTEGGDDDDQYQLDVRFNDDEEKAEAMKLVDTMKRDVTVLPTVLPLSSFMFQAAAVTPVD